MINKFEMLKNFINNPKYAFVQKKETWILCALLGVLFAVIAMPVSSEQGSEQELSVAENASIATAVSGARSELEEVMIYQQELTSTLEHALSQIEGVGEVEVVVTLESTKEDVFYEIREENSSSLQEQDSEGGTREEITKDINTEIVINNEDNPYIVKTLLPKVQGILVIAEGGDDAIVKTNITETLEVLFGIGIHKIKVVKKEVEDW
ncbi:MAG: stage III sporulation protein AG [Lachnospiraceae bacterium]